MRKQLVTLAVAGTVGLTGAVLLSPSVASAATASSSAHPVTSRLSAIKDALAGLVKDDSITQAQADKVASTLADKLPARGPDGRGPGGPGGRRGAHLSPEDAAKVLGITVDELRTAHQAGKTLAQIAASKGLAKADLVKGLVAAAEADLAADVKAGEITQAQADTAKARLTARVTRMVDEVRGPRRDHADHDGDGPGATTPGATTPGATTPGATTPGSSTTPSTGA